ncbi:hypothetical protein WJ438_29625 [Streptomyces sp. GD-15H]|uniref:hypothetical protein n=1 Tax=Streptomyces sp. GD-15H TaxID=3129112 RepID=UPI003243A8A4
MPLRLEGVHQGGRTPVPGGRGLLEPEPAVQPGRAAHQPHLTALPCSAHQVMRKRVQLGDQGGHGHRRVLPQDEHDLRTLLGPLPDPRGRLRGHAAVGVGLRTAERP